MCGLFSRRNRSSREITEDDIAKFIRVINSCRPKRVENFIKRRPSWIKRNIDRRRKILHVAFDCIALLTPEQANERLPAIQMLIDLGADVNAEDIYSNDGVLLRTPLIIAIYSHQVEAVRMLLNNNAEMRIPSGPACAHVGMYTALHLAVHRDARDDQIVRLLLDRGANVNEYNGRDLTPLHVAVYNNRLDLVRVLLSYGADVNKRKPDKYSALYFACTTRNINMIKVLLDAGASTEVSGLDRVTPFHALNHGRPDLNSNSSGNEVCTDIVLIFELLSNKGVDINAKDRHGNTALHKFVNPETIHEFIILCCLSFGAEKDETNNNGDTPLHAILSNLPDPYYNFVCTGATWLILKGADLNIQNKDGLKPINLAVKHIYKPVVNKILSQISGIDEIVVDPDVDETNWNNMLDILGDDRDKLCEFRVAILLKYNDVVQIMLENNHLIPGSPDGCCGNSGVGRTPLLCAIYTLNPTLILKLYEVGCKVGRDDCLFRPEGKLIDHHMNIKYALCIIYTIIDKSIVRNSLSHYIDTLKDEDMLFNNVGLVLDLHFSHHIIDSHTNAEDPDTIIISERISQNPVLSQLYQLSRNTFFRLKNEKVIHDVPQSKFDFVCLNMDGMVDLLDNQLYCQALVEYSYNIRRRSNTEIILYPDDILANRIYLAHRKHGLFALAKYSLNEAFGSLIASMNFSHSPDYLLKNILNYLSIKELRKFCEG